MTFYGYEAKLTLSVGGVEVDVTAALTLRPDPPNEPAVVLDKSVLLELLEKAERG